MSSDMTNPIPALSEGEDHPDRSIDHRRERIRIETERHRIEGYVTLARDGFRSRVSDMLNASERDFLTLTDATVQPLDGGPEENHGFLAVARRHIVFAVVAVVTAAQASSLLYVCGGNLCRINPDGSGNTQLTSDGQQGTANAYASPSISRDGTKLAFVFGYHVVVSDGSAGGRGTPFATTAALVRMRPDGGAVAEIEQTFSSPAFQVCTYNLDGSGRNCPYGTSSAGWAPDGSLLISDSAEALPYNSEIFDCPAAGPSSACTDVRASDSSNDLYDPAVSPDGSTLAVTVSNGIGGEGVGHIALYNYVTGSFERNLTSGSEDELPVFSPDGSEIAFQRGNSIYVTPVSGGPGSERLLVAAGTEPTWGGSEASGGKGESSGGGGGESTHGGETPETQSAGIRLLAHHRATRVTRAGAIALKIACGKGAKCKGSVTLIAAVPGRNHHPRKKRICFAKVSIRAGRTAKVHLRLSAGGRRLLRHHHGHLTVTAKLRWRSEGRPQGTTRKIALTAAARS